MKTFSDKAFVKADITRHCVFSEKEHPWTSRAKVFTCVSRPQISFSRTISRWQLPRFPAVQAVCYVQSLHSVQGRQCTVYKQCLQCSVYRHWGSALWESKAGNHALCHGSALCASSAGQCCHCRFFSLVDSRSGVFLFYLGFWGFHLKSGFFWLRSI